MALYKFKDNLIYIVVSKQYKNKIGGWRDGSKVKNTGYSSRVPEFITQQPHGASQPSVVRSAALFWCAGILPARTPYNININTL